MKVKGSTPGKGIEGPQDARLPTSPRKSRETGSISHGRPTSQVARSRPFQGITAVFAWFGRPKGDDRAAPFERKRSGRRSWSLAEADSMRLVRQAQRSRGAPKLPGWSESRRT